jgi:hypothetical protein
MIQRLGVVVVVVVGVVVGVPPFVCAQRRERIGKANVIRSAAIVNVVIVGVVVVAVVANVVANAAGAAATVVVVLQIGDRVARVHVALQLGERRVDEARRLETRAQAARGRRNVHRGSCGGTRRCTGFEK